MAKIKKPSEVVSQGSFLDTFSVMYGMYDMYHKVQTRRQQGQNYISNAINQAKTEYTENPNNLDVLDGVIERVKRIGEKTSGVRENSELFNNYVTTMNHLNTERLELIDYKNRMSWVDDDGYNISKYVGIQNADGWHAETSTEPSETTKQINEDIAKLNNDRDILAKNKRLNSVDEKIYLAKITELEKLKGFVGYDGVIDVAQLQDFESFANLKSIYDEWQSSYTTKKYQRDMLKDQNKRLEDYSPGTEPGTGMTKEDELKYEENKIQINIIEKEMDGLYNKIKRHQWDMARIPTNKDPLGFNTYINNEDGEGGEGGKGAKGTKGTKGTKWKVGSPINAKTVAGSVPTLAVKFDGANFVNEDGEVVMVDDNDAAKWLRSQHKSDSLKATDEKIKEFKKFTIRDKAVRKVLGAMNGKQRNDAKDIIEKGDYKNLPKEIYEVLPDEKKKYIDANRK